MSEKKSVLESALLEYEEIKHAAEKKLAEELPNKFQNILREELEISNSSYKKIENKDNNNNKDSEMKENKKRTVNEEFDISELDIDSTENIVDNSSDDDELVTIDDIENQIAEMDKLDGELEDASEKEGMSDETSLKDKVDTILKEIEGLKAEKGGEEGGEEDKGEMSADGDDFYANLDKYFNVNEDEAEVDAFGDNHKFDNSDLYGDEYDDEEHLDLSTSELDNWADDGIEDIDVGNFEYEIDEDLNLDEYFDEFESEEGEEEEIEEGLTMTLDHNKNVTGDHLPGKGYASHKEPRKRIGSVNRQNESVNKKYNALLEKNKNLIKKINESKNYKKSVNALLENYKTVLSKYRTQLKEMAIYNTNLSNVNNLLVNEGLALTQDDKIKIIKEFKSVKSINDSKEKYTNLLKEFKSSDKKIIDESVERKVNNSIQPSSKNKLDEVIEKTAYQNDDHLSRIKEVINKIEHR